MRVAAMRDGDDLRQASEVLLRSFAGQENAKMGISYARATLQAFAHEPSRSLLVARLEDRVVGFAAGEPSGSRAARYRRLRGAAAKALLQRPWLLADPEILRMAAKRLKNDAPEASLDRSWFLALIAVDPDFHRRGVGVELLRAFEQEGLRRGFGRACLFVRADNASGHALYERCGWTVSSHIDERRILYERPLAPEMMNRAPVRPC